jgi:DNA primase
MLHENLSFPEAVNLIAERQGLQWKQTGKSRDARGVEETLQKIMDEALSFYRKSLHESREGKECRDYLEARGLTAETLETFDIGYASEEWERLLRHLTQAGFDPRAIEKSGLVIQRREGGGYYDRFRGRFMVPIRSHLGKCLGFGGRVLKDGEPKYLNSPETPIYRKGENLFCLNLAKDSIKKEGYAVLVEGYMDAITVFQAGVRNVIASLGTSLTRGQVNLLKRYTDAVCLNYDSDAAGINAAKRAIPILLEEDFTVTIPVLPPNEDPDSFIRKEGEAEYRRRIGAAVDGFEFVLQCALKDSSQPSEEEKLRALNHVMPLLSSVKSRLRRQAFVSKLASRLGFREDLILEELRYSADQGRQSISVETVSRSGAATEAEVRLLRAVMEDAKLRQLLRPEIEGIDWGGLKTREIFQALLAHPGESDETAFQALLETLKTGEQKEIFCKVHFMEGLQVNEAEARECLKTLKRRNVEHRLSDVQRMIESGRRDAAEIDRLLGQKMELIRVLNSL